MTVVEAGKTVWKRTKLNKLNRPDLMCLAARLVWASKSGLNADALADMVVSLQEVAEASRRIVDSLKLDLKTANGKIVSANQLLGDRAAELRDVRLELDLRWQATRKLEDRAAALVKSNDALLRENVRLDRPHWLKGAALMATGALIAVIVLLWAGMLVAP